MTNVDYTVDGDIAVLRVEHPPVNALSHSVRLYLMDGMRRAQADDRVAALVILGGGSTFMAGADIGEFGTAKSEAPPRLKDIQDALETSAKPTVAAIHGAALGGGLEIALACHARVAIIDAKLGLPEVRLGLLPGAGGTVRLPRLVGPTVALDLMTSGDHVPARRAYDLGIVDAIVDDARQGGIDYARRLARGGLPPSVISRDEKVRNVDPAIFAAYRAGLARKSRGQIAPLKIVDCVEAACTLSATEALAVESAAFQELLNGDQRKALTHYFFAEREARKILGLPPTVTFPSIQRVAVIGAGTMGGGIAMVFANAGMPVVLLDASGDALAKGRSAIEKNYAASVRRGSMSEAQMESALARIRGTTDYSDLGDADLAVEAVFEDMDLKKQIFAQLDAATPSRAILGTNTSSLDIDEIANATKRPEQVIGTHFFSPANVMKLMENVRGSKTSLKTIAAVMALGKSIGKITVLAGNCDGFIGNRMLQFYTGEAEFMLEEGATPEQIDRVAEAFGMAMGPLAMRDLAGMDVACLVRKERRKRYPDLRMSPILERLVETGRLGQKNGKGYYRYEGRVRSLDSEAMSVIESVSRELGIKRRDFSDDEVRSRLFHPLVNEGAKELEEGIAARAGDIDVVWVNGYSFPAHRGGPMYWGEADGLAAVLETARMLGAKHGPRWSPSALLGRLVASGAGWGGIPEGG